MDKPIENYWKLRLADVKLALEANNFEVYLAEDTHQANAIVLEKLLPKLNPKTVSWGGSVTFTDSGLYRELKENPDLEVLDTFDQKKTNEQKHELRRKALLVDLFITGTNAITESGQIVNLDMIGNRVGALTFGPKWVILMIGRNKIVTNLDEAMYRIKNY
ncbi:MAG: lactate utilization protein, partial [Desulfobacterales bacterium]